LAERENPYLPRVDKVTRRGSEAVTVLPAGAATVRRVDDGAAVLADLGVMTASQAAWAADTVNAAGKGNLVSVTVGSM
jgi:hypothetical protein